MPPPDDESPPASILELAHACVQAVANATKIELDFTQDTLPVLDHYLDAAKGPRDEIVGLVAPMAGAYFGEVLRRALGPARWELVDDDYGACRLRFPQAGLALNPIGVALESLLRTSIGDVGAHLDVPEACRERVAAALDLFGDVREDDFYRLAVRYEGIEQALAALSPEIAERKRPSELN